MAAKNFVSTSKPAKLLSTMKPYGYKRYYASLTEGESISLEFFKASKWVNYFALDTYLTFKNGKVNPNHVYKLFGSFNGLNARNVRSDLLEYIYDNIDFFDDRCVVCLLLCNIGLSTLVDNVENSQVCCDKLALLGLSAMYKCHTLVVTKHRFWSTIESDVPLNIITLMKECTVHLLYLGNLKFGTLRWQPCYPQPALSRLNRGKFNIVHIRRTKYLWRRLHSGS